MTGGGQDARMVAISGNSKQTQSSFTAIAENVGDSMEASEQNPVVLSDQLEDTITVDHLDS